MTIRKHLGYLLLLLILWTVQAPEAFAQKAPQHHFDQEKMNKYRNSRDFFYVEMNVNQEDYYDILRSYFFRALSDIFDSRTSRFIADNFEYIIIGIVLLIIYFNRKKFKFDKIFIKNKEASKIILDFDEENIEEVDFEALTKNALLNGNYKLAIRYQFLDVLKRLSNAGIIEWQPYKTNYEYLLEIKKGELRNHFRKAALVFDYIWYGNLELSPEDYRESLDELKMIKQKLPDA
jgi:hypothetical protein